VLAVELVELLDVALVPVDVLLALPPPAPVLLVPLPVPAPEDGPAVSDPEQAAHRTVPAPTRRNIQTFAPETRKRRI